MIGSLSKLEFEFSLSYRSQSESDSWSESESKSEAYSNGKLNSWISSQPPGLRTLRSKSVDALCEIV